ncbi:MAG: QueT transporter family protein [Clostridia bacterium]|nr:QueT transporter family protein [Oscillospiraceae bacterium]MDO4354525.1 QueT transporter family protein [Clostridia bacterium]MDY2909467.1 QueT transporter family protein [Oscillospiraceae bacterium]
MRGLSYKLAFAAVVGALYAILTMVLAPISYGPLQFRISEALCVLSYFTPAAAWGLFIGCAIANTLSAAGLPDVIFGSLATLIACLGMSAVGKHMKDSLKSRLLACFLPVIVNAVIVGAMLTYAYIGLSPLEHPGAFAVCAGEVALGELPVMYLFGLPLMSWLPKYLPLDKLRNNNEQ